MIENALTWLEESLGSEALQQPALLHQSLQPRMKPTTPTTTKPGNHEFELLTLLGEGGMGQVFLAKQRSLDRQVAVKTIKPSRVSDVTQLAMLHEAKLTGALEHPNIIPLHLLSRDPEGSPMMVMKRVEGTTWKELLQDQQHRYWAKTPEERLQQNLEILMQVCNAIHFAHSQGIIHRDIKPANIMVGNFGEVYVLDWGLAVLLDEEGHNTSQSIAGTLSYMAPEMLVRGSKLSPKTDVYLLGATLYEVLTGAVFHQGATMVEVLKSALLPTQHKYPTGSPEALVALCEEATAHLPEQRVGSALMFRQRLATFLQRRTAIELGRVAQEKLQTLEALLQRESSVPFEVYNLLGEIRFGFEQALRGWPESESPRRGLLQLAERMAEFELRQRNVGAARGYLAQLPSPSAELLARLDAVERSVAKEREAVETLKAMEYQQSTKISAGQRILVMIMGNVNVLGGLFFIAYLSPVELWQTSPGYLLVMQLFFGTGVAVIAFSTRSFFFRNRANQRLYSASLFLATILLLSHALGVLLSATALEIFLSDLFLWALFSGLLGIFFAEIFLWNGLSNIVLVVVVLLFPKGAPWLVWFSFFLMTVSVGIEWQRSLEKDGKTGLGNL
jgi:eukaryotic-like serine/threonine-protein kinase